MEIKFSKYQGAGNDFVMIDDRENRFPVNDYDLVKRICDRHFGIGADGLILLQNAEGFDFRMLYYNSDGKPSTFCGNGGRCIAAFAEELEVIADPYHFMAADSSHKAWKEKEVIVLQMKDVEQVNDKGDDLVINTGSPHYIRFISEGEKLYGMDILAPAKAIRYNEEFKKEGINVNFVEVAGKNHIKIRTYERGVEDETLACGTGVAASAIAYFEYYGDEEKPGLITINVDAVGGSLQVRFRYNEGKYEQVALIGKAEKVFEGRFTYHESEFPILNS